MAAVTPHAKRAAYIRAAYPADGEVLARLWRDLWDAHEAWGGYPGTRDPRVYADVAERLEEDAHVRGGQPVLGRHIHLVAETHEGVVGQVEGWFERHGIDETTPITCEVRSLIVSSRSRSRGVGRALLERLSSVARQLASGSPVVLAAEVLEPNPAHAFYTNIGYSPVSWTARVSTDGPPLDMAPSPYSVRVATAADARSIALLEPALAARRRAQGDRRFDRPRAVDASYVDALATHLAERSSADHRELVVVDPGGVVRASSTLSIASLEAPFLPARRGLLGRFAVDPALSPKPLVGVLTRFARRLALVRGAATLELTDLDAPGQPLSDGAKFSGAVPWSRVVQRFA